jgi:hypothetical protein
LKNLKILKNKKRVTVVKKSQYSKSSGCNRARNWNDNLYRLL